MNIYDDYFGLGDMAQIVNDPINVESMFNGFGQSRGGDTMGQDFFQLGQSEGASVFGREYLGLGQSPHGDGPDYYGFEQGGDQGDYYGLGQTPGGNGPESYGLGEYNPAAYSYGLGRLNGSSIENLKSQALAAALPVLQSASRTAAAAGAGSISTAIVNTGRLFETKIGEATTAAQIGALVAWLQGKVSGLVAQIQQRVDTTEVDPSTFPGARSPTSPVDPATESEAPEGSTTMLWAGGLLMGAIGLYLLYKE